VKRTVARLADGREIIYFDEADDTVRLVDDRRELPARAAGSHLRYDPILDEWIVIAAHRQDRTHLPAVADCPLCPSRPGRSSEVPTDSYDVVVFENRFPSLSMAAAGQPDAPESELFPRQPGTGRCEVVCFTSDHTGSFATLPAARARLVVDVWADRTLELAALPGIEQVFCFENRGQDVGVTLHHPHGQIYAYPFVTPTTRRMLDSARRYRERTRRDLFADVLAAEQFAGVRVVVENAHWCAFVPATARWPVEVHLYPRRRVPDLPALTDPERDALAAIYLDLLGRLDRLYDAALPYIAAWHQAPVRADRHLAYLHLRLVSPRRTAQRLKYLAGSEVAMGAFLGDVLPEDTARRLRELAP
jgi:UDPglucose--hexose-1-phosphate uridylyltransferase